MSEPSPFGELESRSARRQGIPPSRTGARTDIVVFPPAAVDERPAAPPNAPTAVEAAPQSATVEVNDLVKTTIHLGKANDDLLNLVSFTGKQSTPKVDASRSAVVRLAIRHLAEAMTPEEIVEELRRTAPADKIGRPRLS